MARWYESSSLAFGDANDVTACARVFQDVASAMARARPRTVQVTNTGNDVWSGDSADVVRQLLAEIPELLRRSGQANGAVADALTGFAPRLADYQHDLWSLQRQGGSTAHELESVEHQRANTIDRLRSQESDIEQIIAWTYTYDDHPEVAPLNARLGRLQHELDALERRFERNGDDFESAVDLAVGLIRSADDVLYNNGWDEFWSKTLSPVLDVVRIVLEIATVVLVIAALIGSGGTLAPLIFAGLLLAVSVTQVVGTAAAGREVTAEMWLNLAIDFAAIATLGLARYAKGLKVAANANRVQADKILKGGKASFHAAGQHLAKMQKIDRMVKVADNVEIAVRVGETVEGGLIAGEGLVEVIGGDQKGWLKVVTGAADVGGAGGAAIDVSKGVRDGIGAGEGIADLSGGGSESQARSPKEWPGLDGLRSPQ